MLKQTALFLAILGVAGCDIDLSSLRPVKWATVNVDEVREAVKSEVVAENLYPVEPEIMKGGDSEFSRIRSQISKLKSYASINCKEKHMSSFPEKREFTFSQNSLPLGASRAMQDCLQAIEDDQLISDLNVKLKVYDDYRYLRRDHERNVNVKADARAREFVSSYGKLNGYELIVEERSAGVVYNASNMVVNVTGGVLDSIAK